MYKSIQTNKQRQKQKQPSGASGVAKVGAGHVPPTDDTRAPPLPEHLQSSGHFFFF